jgi:3-deoxy-7-phosphoheptulonate synthase
MIITMKRQATVTQTAQVIARVEQWGYRVHLWESEEGTAIGLIGRGRSLDPEQLAALDGVERVTTTQQPFKLAGRELHPQDTVVRVNDVSIGGPCLVVMAGPCAVESQEQILQTAHAVKQAGAHILRGGAFKPRTSPYSFQGLGEKGLHLLALAREQTGLSVVTEVVDPQQVPLVTAYADILQIGARNMQNYALLHAVGESRRPVLLKRGLMSTVEELLMAAEYILSHGNDRVILCERGIRTFERYTRNTLDIAAVALLKQLSHLPVIADPSHSTGKWELVEPVSLAAVAAGADGLLIEVHPHPEKALSDGAQSLKPARFAALMQNVRRLGQTLGRTL